MLRKLATRNVATLQVPVDLLYVAVMQQAYIVRCCKLYGGSGVGVVCYDAGIMRMLMLHSSRYLLHGLVPHGLAVFFALND